MQDDDAKTMRNRLAQRRWRERIKADPEKYEALKRAARRWQRIYYQQNPDYAERKRAQHNKRYANDPEFRNRSAERNRTPHELQRRRALQCLTRGDTKYLPDQLQIIMRRAKRLLREISET